MKYMVYLAFEYNIEVVYLCLSFPMIYNGQKLELCNKGYGWIPKGCYNWDFVATLPVTKV